MLESSYSFIIITPSSPKPFVSGFQGQFTSCSKLWLKRSKIRGKTLSFRVDVPFDGTGTFLHNDTMHYIIKSHAESGLTSKQLVFI